MGTTARRAASVVAFAVLAAAIAMPAMRSVRGPAGFSGAGAGVLVGFALAVAGYPLLRKVQQSDNPYRWMMAGAALRFVGLLLSVTLVALFTALDAPSFAAGLLLTLVPLQVLEAVWVARATSAGGSLEGPKES